MLIISGGRVLQLSERAQDEWSCHLLAVVHQVVGVVERTRSQITSLRRGAHALVVEPRADESLRCGLDFERRGRNAAEYHARVRDHAVLVNVEPRCDAEHGEVERAAPTKLFIDRSPARRRWQLNLRKQLV